MNNQPTNNRPEDQLRLIVRDEVTKLLTTHLKLCPFASLNVEPRLRKLETNFASFIGWAIGSGLLSGTVVAGIFQWTK